MAKRALALAALACLAGPGAQAAGPSGEREPAGQALVIRGSEDQPLASLPLQGGEFAVSYRNSIYGTIAEERYRTLPGGAYRLIEIAADQLAVLEEYYAVPLAPERADAADRRQWVVPPDPARPFVVRELSIAATDRGQRTVHVAGEPPLELWKLVDDRQPFVILQIEEIP